MYVSKIVYMHVRRLDKLKDILNELNFDFIEKVESEMNPEVWVSYSNILVGHLLKAGFISNQDKLDLNKTAQSSGITEILFYA